MEDPGADFQAVARQPWDSFQRVPRLKSYFFSSARACNDISLVFFVFFITIIILCFVLSLLSHFICFCFVGHLSDEHSAPSPGTTSMFSIVSYYCPRHRITLSHTPSLSSLPLERRRHHSPSPPIHLSIMFYVVKNFFCMLDPRQCPTADASPPSPVQPYIVHLKRISITYTAFGVCRFADVVFCSANVLLCTSGI